MSSFGLWEGPCGQELWAVWTVAETVTNVRYEVFANDRQLTGHRRESLVAGHKDMQYLVWIANQVPKPEQYTVRFEYTDASGHREQQTFTMSTSKELPFFSDAFSVIATARVNEETFEVTLDSDFTGRVDYAVPHDAAACPLSHHSYQPSVEFIATVPFRLSLSYGSILSGTEVNVLLATTDASGAPRFDFVPVTAP